MESEAKTHNNTKKEVGPGNALGLILTMIQSRKTGWRRKALSRHIICGAAILCMGACALVGCQRQPVAMINAQPWDGTVGHAATTAYTSGGEARKTSTSIQNRMVIADEISRMLAIQRAGKAPGVIRG